MILKGQKVIHVMKVQMPAGFQVLSRQLYIKTSNLKLLVLLLIVLLTYKSNCGSNLFHTYQLELA